MDQTPPAEFIPIYLRTMRVNTLQSFSIYIKVVDNYVLYHSGGEKLTEGVLNKLIENKIVYVYIRKQDTEAYLQYLSENLSKTLKDPDVSLKEKSEIANVSIRSIAFTFFDKPSEETLKQYMTSVATLAEYILTYEEAIYTLIRLTSNKYGISTHSINVGMYATGLAKNLLADDPSHNIKEISAGFFLHDVGKSLIPGQILYKNGPLTHSEWKTMKRHPTEGFKLLNQFNLNSNEIKIITTQHHERKNGKGYPIGIKGDGIHIYSKICSIADSFEALTATRPYKKRNESSFNALLILKNEMMNEFDPFFFQQFVLLFREALEQSKPKTVVQLS
ncbi:HD domain-containing protein [bacterium]|nr:HD domain-containing protein [bacterium]